MQSSSNMPFAQSFAVFLCMVVLYRANCNVEEVVDDTVSALQLYASTHSERAAVEQSFDLARHASVMHASDLCSDSASIPKDSGVTHLKTLFDAKFRDNFQTLFGQQQSEIIFTVGDHHAKAMQYNFMAHVTQATAKKRSNRSFVHVALDEENWKLCMDLAQKYDTWRITCVNLNTWIPLSNLLNGGSGFEACTWRIVCWSKAFLFVQAVHASTHSVLLADLDVVIRKDIIDVLNANKSAGPCLLAVKETGNNGVAFGVEVNSGLVYANRDSLGILDEWSHENDRSVGHELPDQEALNAVLQASPSSRCFIDKAIVGECGAVAEYATHYNCLSDNDLKVRAMRRKGDWLADELA